ncbi:MAG: N-acetylmuramic acid 6-phosphate etherase [Candidatus Kaistia colombiensis]|nr:MAG: N-acetylmuramic acid 6-phosphate etherase [Kaistia sp.]
MEDRFEGIDLWPTVDALAALAEGQIRGARWPFAPPSPALAAAAERAAACLARGGRLVYFGAGSVGRCSPSSTRWKFRRPSAFRESQILVLMAGGMAMTETLTGGPEDVAEFGIADIEGAKLGPDDCVVAASASGSTPYTVAGLRGGAEDRREPAVAIACNASALLFAHGDDVAVHPRCRAGSAGRLDAHGGRHGAEGRLSTCCRPWPRSGSAMCVDGQMVNVRADNGKLRGRGPRGSYRQRSPGVDDGARRARRSTPAGGEVKPAILIAAGAKVMPAQADALLEQNNAGNRAQGLGGNRRTGPKRNCITPTRPRRRGRAAPERSRTMNTTMRADAAGDGGRGDRVPERSRSGVSQKTSR